MPADGLIDRHVQFVGALRGAGLPVLVVESLDATQAIDVLDLMDPERLRAAYPSAVVKLAPHRATFDRLFDLWWPPAIGDGEASTADHAADDVPEEVEPPVLAAMRTALREQLREVLLAGEEEALRRSPR